ncbi:LysR family transcriptional regulator [Rhizobiaceae bacterium n13]|uniref:LysR family transcriptional regulator n=1 Tax=Ferirhizobium litorale TaxID=2927786 RepID=A0AAE3U1E3_9HYPH|nr:LysR family transcriptional regulator [Fererhizobium litorale]MDI7861375.1 LysR family transcriptional regulator [Fererhizobium litorale]MDI7921522.1 LysR family transcriptional regulator [Fererhizobium litorale]
MPNLINESPGLIAFVRTVETGSFSAAARSLKTTPSAISKSVGRLEKHIRARLFIRSTRALTLTPDGQAFFDRVAPLLKELDTSDEVIHAAAGPAGRLRVSMPSELAALLMEPLLSKFAREHPQVHLDLGLTDRYVDLIREDYDVVFRVGQTLQGDLMVRRLAELDMVLVASPAYVATFGNPASIDDLRDLPFARYSLGGRPRAVQFSNGTSISPRGRMDCDSGYGLHAAALQGMGIAHLMRCVVEKDLSSGDLVRILPNEPLPALPFNALHAFGRMVPARVKLLCDFIAQETKALSAE